MNNLNAFLNPVSVDDTKSVVISERFRGEDGKPVPFVIKAITQAENNRLIKRATTAKVVRGQRVDNFDNEMYTNSLILACTIEPDFSNAELCKAYGTMDPMEVPRACSCRASSQSFPRRSSSLTASTSTSSRRLKKTQKTDQQRRARRVAELLHVREFRHVSARGRRAIHA